MEFESLSELYMRVRPALTTKHRELKRVGYSYIKEEDIWNYLKEAKWKISEGLSLAEIVNDILNCDNSLIDSYLKQKIEMIKREPNLDE